MEIVIKDINHETKTHSLGLWLTARWSHTVANPFTILKCQNHFVKMSKWFWHLERQPRILERQPRRNQLCSTRTDFTHDRGMIKQLYHFITEELLTGELCRLPCSCNEPQAQSHQQLAANSGLTYCSYTGGISRATAKIEQGFTQVSMVVLIPNQQSDGHLGLLQTLQLRDGDLGQSSAIWGWFGGFGLFFFLMF